MKNKGSTKAKQPVPKEPPKTLKNPLEKDQGTIKIEDFKSPSKENALNSSGKSGDLKPKVFIDLTETETTTPPPKSNSKLDSDKENQDSTKSTKKSTFIILSQKEQPTTEASKTFEKPEISNIESESDESESDDPNTSEEEEEIDESYKEHYKELSEAATDSEKVEKELEESSKKIEKELDHSSNTDYVGMLTEEAVNDVQSFEEFMESPVDTYKFLKETYQLRKGTTMKNLLKKKEEISEKFKHQITTHIKANPSDYHLLNLESWINMKTFDDIFMTIERLGLSNLFNLKGMKANQSSNHMNKSDFFAFIIDVFDNQLIIDSEHTQERIYKIYSSFFNIDKGEKNYFEEIKKDLKSKREKNLLQTYLSPFNRLCFLYTIIKEEPIKDALDFSVYSSEKLQMKEISKIFKQLDLPFSNISKIDFNIMVKFWLKSSLNQDIIKKKNIFDQINETHKMTEEEGASLSDIVDSSIFEKVGKEIFDPEFTKDDFNITILKSLKVDRLLIFHKFILSYIPTLSRFGKLKRNMIPLYQSYFNERFNNKPQFDENSYTTFQKDALKDNEVNLDLKFHHQSVIIPLQKNEDLDDVDLSGEIKLEDLEEMTGKKNNTNSNPVYNPRDRTRNLNERVFQLLPIQNQKIWIKNGSLSYRMIKNEQNTKEWISVLLRIYGVNAYYAFLRTFEKEKIQEFFLLWVKKYSSSIRLDTIEDKVKSISRCCVQLGRKGKDDNPVYADRLSDLYKSINPLYDRNPKQAKGPKGDNQRLLLYIMCPDPQIKAAFSLQHATVSRSINIRNYLGRDVIIYYSWINIGQENQRPIFSMLFDNRNRKSASGKVCTSIVTPCANLSISDSYIISSFFYSKGYLGKYKSFLELIPNVCGQIPIAKEYLDTHLFEENIHCKTLNREMKRACSVLYIEKEEKWSSHGIRVEGSSETVIRGIKKNQLQDTLQTVSIQMQSTENTGNALRYFRNNAIHWIDYHDENTEISSTDLLLHKSFKRYYRDYINNSSTKELNLIVTLFEAFSRAPLDYKEKSIGKKKLIVYFEIREMIKYNEKGGEKKVIDYYLGHKEEYKYITEIVPEPEKITYEYALGVITTSYLLEKHLKMMEFLEGAEKMKIREMNDTEKKYMVEGISKDLLKLKEIVHKRNQNGAIISGTVETPTKKQKMDQEFIEISMKDQLIEQRPKSRIIIENIPEEIEKVFDESYSTKNLEKFNNLKQKVYDEIEQLESCNKRNEKDLSTLKEMVSLIQESELALKKHISPTKFNPEERIEMLKKKNSGK